MRAALSWIFASCSLALWLGGCATAPFPDVSRLERQFDALERRGFSGQVLIMQGEDILLVRGYGSRDATGAPVATEDVMPLASVTKPLTASLVLALAADGQIELDAPVTRYLPALGDAWRPARIRHLLAHTAGLPAEIHRRGWGGDPQFEPVDRKTFIRRVARFEPDHAPGARFNYSNVGYGLLGAVIETVTGRDWEYVLAGRLLEPCGIEDIGLLRPAWPADRLVHGRRAGGDWGTYFDRPWLDDGLGWNLRASGDLHAAPAGIVAWWRCLHAGAWLPEAMMTRWLTPVTDDAGGGQYGLGLEFRRSAAGPSIGHAGGNRVFAVDWRWYPAHAVMIYIASADDRFEADTLDIMP